MQELTVRGFSGMDDSLKPQPDLSKALLLLNCRVEPGGTDVVLRGAWKRTGTTVVSQATTPNPIFFEFINASGTVIWVLISGGKFYTLNSSGVPTETLTAANLSSASVTLSATAAVRIVAYGSQVVISDGANTPWMWDGTANGGITKLTNAPVAYSDPAVYYARLFFIKNTDQKSIVWSEVNSANTGYEAGGFNNAWSLTQSGQKTLTTILGTNIGLYYWRSDSIGLIRGAVTATFSTDGTHDGIATGIGTLGGNRPLLFFGRYIWFADAFGRPWRMVEGGALEPIWKQAPRTMASLQGLTTSVAIKPYNILENVGLGSTIIAIVPYPPENAVLVIGNGNGAGAAGTYTVARFDAVTGAFLCYEQWPGASSGWGWLANLGTFGMLGMVSSNGIVMAYRADPFNVQLWGTDQTGASTSVAYVGTIIGPAQGYQESVDWNFDEIDVVFETQSTDSAGLVKVDYVTDLEHYSTLQAAQQTVTNYDVTYQLKEQRGRFGINGSGSWIRVRVQLSANERCALKGWTVKAFAVPAETVVVT